MEWQSIAKTLPDGGKVRMQHCGDDKSMIVSRDGSRLHAYCFRCGLNECDNAGQLTFAELEARRKAEAKYKAYKQPILPSDFTKDIPKEGRVWLYKAAVYGPLLDKYNIGWSPRMARVILPIYDRAGKLLGTQARAVMPGQKPKYLTSMPAPAVFYTHCTETVVLVEDILSAIRVGVHASCIALLGTCTPVHIVLPRLQENGHTSVLCWFDPDRAGDKAWDTMSKQLQLAGYAVRRVRADKDPKLYSRREIGEILGRYLD